MDTEPITLSELAAKLDRTYGCVYQMVTVGRKSISGTIVKLKAFKGPSGRYTTMAEYQKFIARMNQSPRRASRKKKLDTPIRLVVPTLLDTLFQSRTQQLIETASTNDFCRIRMKALAEIGQVLQPPLTRLTLVHETQP